MNFEPPDFTKDLSFGGSRSQQNPKGVANYSRPQYQETHDNSPLLRTVPTTNANGPPSNTQMRNNSNKGYQSFRNPIYNRLGARNNYQHRNNNPSDNAQSGNQGQRFNNRKRTGDNVAGGPMMPKRKWYPNANSSQGHTSVQNRLNRIRNPNLREEEIQTNNNSFGNITKNNSFDNNAISPPYLNDSQELDPTDITVQVVNNTAVTTPLEDSTVSRFKMILDPKCQKAIHLLQQKRKDKQVIFPFPVTPNVTEVTLHERFSLL